MLHSAAIIAPGMLPTEAGSDRADRRPRHHQEVGILLAMLLNVADVRVPTVRLATNATITSNASITAYSTAVGPSSDTKKRRTHFTNFRAMIRPFPKEPADRRRADLEHRSISGGVEPAPTRATPM